MRRLSNFLTLDAQQQAFNFLTAQTYRIEAQVYRIQYPNIQYPRLVPVDTSAPEWSKGTTYFSIDQFGRADWFNHQAHDIPLADVSREKFERAFEMAAIGYRYDLEEIGQAMLLPGGGNLTADKAAAARRAYEEFVDDVALRGGTGKGWTGLINDATVNATTVPADGTGSSTLWANKTPTQIARDFNNALTGIWTTSLNVEMADTVLLPIGVMTNIATMPFNTTSDISTLDWIREYNVYTMQTGQALNIIGVRGLEVAGAGSTNRGVFYRRDDQVVRLHMPMPHRFLPVWQRAPLAFDVPGIFRTGGVEVRRPTAMRYIDGI